MKSILISFFVFLSIISVAQEEFVSEKKHQKGKIYIYWGWNRAFFSNSDIHFSGSDHDFTLSNVVAHDRQTPFSLDPYFNPARVSIPQTNFRIGYFISDKWEISIGVDHMKYVMDQNQYVAINGSISTADTEFNGIYNGEEIQLTEDFLTFEHTDGLNYANIELNRFENIFQFNEISKVNIDINVLGGFGAGLLYPKSNVMLFGKNRNDEFHTAGFGLSAKMGFNITFWDYFFLQNEYKLGYINMPDILTSTVSDYKADQQFSYFQMNIVFGAIFPIVKSEK